VEVSWKIVLESSLVIIIIIPRQFLGCCLNGQSHFQSSPSSPAFRLSQSTLAVSPPVGCCHPHPPSPFIITQPESCYSFYYPTEGGRLNRPGHFSKGVQPVPKAVYRSSCHAKHSRLQCDSNPGPLTLQSDALTTIPNESVPKIIINNTINLNK